VGKHKAMWIEEAQRRILERMTPQERAVFDQGCQIVDFYMSIAENQSLPASTRMQARDKLRAFACRGAGETVADIDGKASN